MSSTEVGGHGVESDRKRRLVILAICCLSLLIVGLDSTIVNVALPAIGSDFHASVSGLQWTIDAYTLVIASLLLLSGSTADRLGRKRTFQVGLVVFTIGSLLCSLAPGLDWLVAARMVQAVGGSMLNPVAMSIITNVFDDPRERAQAIGVWGGVVGISLALGPVVGGALVGSVGWPSIFLINLPVGVAAIILTQMFVPESRAPRPRRVDPVGQLLVIAVLGTTTYAIIEGPANGWTSAATVGLFGFSLACLLGLLAYERRIAQPLIETGFFRSAPFSGATFMALCSFGALGGFLFLNTLYLQDVRSFSALQAGLLTLPMAAMAILFAPISGRVVGRSGPRLPLLVAGIGLGGGGLMLTGLSSHTSLWWLTFAYLVFGVGFGWVNPPITNTAVSGMPRSQAGVAAGFASTSRQVGTSLGVAVIGSTAVSSAVGGLHLGLAASSHIGWWVVACCGLSVVVAGLVTTGAWARGTAAAVAASFTPDGGGGDDTRQPVVVSVPV